jgi:hypothetical protein
MNRRMAASKNLQSRERCRSDLNQLLRETGGRLLDWHHGKLKSSDFHFPYQLLAEARKANIEVREYAEARKLGAYVVPVRMTFRRQWAFQRLLLDPETGMPILDSLKPFIGRKYSLAALLYAAASVSGLAVFLLYSQLKILWIEHRIWRLRRVVDLIRRLRTAMVGRRERADD